MSESEIKSCVKLPDPEDHEIGNVLFQPNRTGLLVWAASFVGISSLGIAAVTLMSRLGDQATVIERATHSPEALACVLGIAVLAWPIGAVAWVFHLDQCHYDRYEEHHHPVVELLKTVRVLRSTS